MRREREDQTSATEGEDAGTAVFDMATLPFSQLWLNYKSTSGESYGETAVGCNGPGRTTVQRIDGQIQVQTHTSPAAHRIT